MRMLIVLIWLCLGFTNGALGQAERLVHFPEDQEVG